MQELNDVTEFFLAGIFDLSTLSLIIWVTSPVWFLLYWLVGSRLGSVNDFMLKVIEKYKK